MKKFLPILFMTLFSPSITQSAETYNRIDIIRPDAPELAAFGSYRVGVRTLEMTDPERPDILNTQTGQATQYYPRTLTVEVWYPATSTYTQTGTEYTTTTRNPQIKAILHGRANRDAKPASGQRFPLVILSHGYPGNRYLMSHLGENLASKGYVVASIDHRDSTYEDQKTFASTLYNRPLDQRFVLSAMDGLSHQEGHFLHGLVDAGNTGLIGYSMGGYGVINNLGAGFSDAVASFDTAPPNQLLNELAASNPDYRAKLDSRFKAGIPIAPWGMNMGLWDAGGLSGLTAPVLFVAGDADTTAGYRNGGVRDIYEQAGANERYLLVFHNAGHSVAAPIPLPVEFLDRGNVAGASHYTDPVWDSVRMNNILQHFVTAFFDLHLKDDTSRHQYLTLAEDGAAEGGQSWKGFTESSGIGLKMYRPE